MICDAVKHNTIPTIVGIMNERAVHFILPVSFFMVRHVVPHGKCIIEKIITHIAVLYVQPFNTNSSFNDIKDSKSKILPLHM